MTMLLMTQNGMNGLHLASKEGHINVVLELLARAASVDSSTKVTYDVVSCATITRGEVRWFYGGDYWVWVWSVKGA